MENKDILKNACEEVLKNSYSPYSDIKVAAAILTKSGKVFTGINVENSSYSITSCAEKNAIMNAVTNGEKDFAALAVLTDSKLVKSPCGSCRQVIYEFSKDLPIYFYGPDDYYREFNIKELLPEGFNLWKKNLSPVL